MKARFVHRCTHVLDKEATIAFYEEALGFRVLRENPAMGLYFIQDPDGCWIEILPE